MKVFHGTNKILSTLKQGSWITDCFKTAQTFGDHVHTLKVDEDDIEWDVCATMDTIDNRGTLKKSCDIVHTHLKYIYSRTRFKTQNWELLPDICGGWRKAMLDFYHMWN